MGIFSWLGRTFGLRDPQPWSEYYGGRSKAGQSVTVDTALQLSTVWACVGLVSRTIATLPLGVYERKKDGSREAVGGHPVARLLRDPNADVTSTEFMEAEAQSLLLWGNSFSERVGSGDVPSSLIRLEPHRLKVFRDQRNRLAFEYAERDGRTRDLTEKQVFIIRGQYMGGDLGVSAIKYGCNSMGVAMAAEEAASQLYENGMHSNGFIKVPQLIKDKAQRDQFVDQWIKPLQGARNAGKIGVLEGGMEWIEATMKAVDAELLASRRNSVEDICRWFGVPPIMIGHTAQGQTMWGSGVEQINLAFLIHGIRPWLKRIESAMNKRLIPIADRGRIYVEFNVEGLLQADSKGRAEMYSKLFQIAGITPNQIAEKENLPKFDGGDQRFVNSTYVPIELAGQKATTPTPEPETDDEE
jgi:HK97 family phage portal protein